MPRETVLVSRALVTGVTSCGTMASRLALNRNDAQTRAIVVSISLFVGRDRGLSIWSSAVSASQGQALVAGAPRDDRYYHRSHHRDSR